MGVLALAATAQAEVIVLKNGKKIQGEIVSQTDETVKVQVKQHGITMTRSFQRTAIASVLKDDQAGVEKVDAAADRNDGRKDSRTESPRRRGKSAAASRKSANNRTTSPKGQRPPAESSTDDVASDSGCVVKSRRVMPANPQFVSKTSHGRLEMIGQGDEQIRLVTVWGTPFERGRAQGELLRKEVASHTSRLIELMMKGENRSVEALDEVYAATKPHTPAYFIEELKGLSDGSGIPLQQIVRANLIGEASEWHCSLFGAWGKATKADGHVYQLRALDYAVRAEIQRHPAIIVQVPDKGHPFANIGWAGVVGAVSGISSAAIAISEIGDRYDKENDTFDGPVTG